MSASPRTYLGFLPPVSPWLPPIHDMVVSPVIRQRLSTRDDDPTPSSSTWGPMQIAAPVIVGGALLLAIAAYVIWKRRRSRSHAYNYHQVTSVPNNQRMRRPAMPSIIPSTPHQRLDSTDSHTPLTLADYQSFPPVPRVPDSPPPMARQPVVRWWWFFGSRPQQIKSEEPGSRWRVDGPDGSSTGHGHNNHEEYRARYVGYLEASQEESMNDGGIGATPSRPVREMAYLPDRAGTFVTPIPAPIVVVPPRSNESATQASSGDRGLPPSYDASHTHSQVHHPLIKTTPVVRSQSHFPPAPRAVRYMSPRTFNGRELPSRVQSPMVATY